MKLTVINLDRAVDRRCEIATHLEALGLEFNFHSAVDGLAFPAIYREQVDWRGARRDGCFLQMGSVANWISQCQVFRDMVENGPDVMAVLEDDAVPTRALPPVLQMLESMIDEYDIVFLHHGPERPFVPQIALATGHQVGRLRWSHFGTQGYVITRRAAEVFLDKFPLAKTGIDRALASYWRHGLRTFCLRPAVVQHAEHFQHYNSLKWQAPVIRWWDPLWRMRRGWFRTKEGVAKRIAFSRLMLSEHGRIGGFQRIVRPD